jgi:nitrogen fixation protein NifX
MLRTAILYLKGEDSPSEPLPVAQPDHPYTDAAELLRVACASNQGEQIDGHFGSCARFLIYDVCPDGFALAEIRTPNEAIREGELEIDRTLRRAQLLQDCDLLFVLSIGGPPAARVTRLGVHPVKIKETSPCSSLLEEVQDTLKKSSLPRWIRAKRLQAEALSA